MSTLTFCPECEAKVGVPDGTHPSAQVRCPLCEHEFTLGESVPDDVPELIVVDPGLVETADESAAQAAEGSDGEDSKPADDAAAAEQEAKKAGDEGEKSGADFLAGLAAADDGASEQVSFNSFGDSGEKSDEDGESSVATKEGKEEGEGAAAFDFGQSDDDAEGDADAEKTAAARPPRKAMSLKGQLIGMVVFGVIGLGLGYGILLLIAPGKATALKNTVLNIIGLDGKDDDGKNRDIPKPQDAEKSDPHDDGGIGTPGHLLNGGRGNNGEANGKSKPDEEGEVDPFEIPNIDPVDPPDAAEGPRGFRALLGGQPDSGGVFKSASFDAVDEAIAEASNLSEDNTVQYLAMCKIGSGLANLDDTDPRFGSVKKRADQLMAVARAHIGADDLKTVSYKWVRERPEKYKDKTGIFLSGRVSKVRKRARVSSLHVTEIEIKQGAAVILLTTSAANLANGSKVVILGSIVDEAETKLPGYSLTEVPQDFDASPSTLILGAAVMKVE